MGRLFFVIGFITCFTANSQSTTPLSQVCTFQWTGENGLISNNITSTFQSKDGFIWICTYNGLMRFDGISVEVFDRTNIPFLTSDAFYRGYNGPDDKLYFVTQASGIIEYKNNEFSPFLIKSGNLPKAVMCLLPVNDSTILAGTVNSGLFIITNNVVSPIENTVLSKATITDIIEDDNKNIWIATEGDGVFKYNGKEFQQWDTSKGLGSNDIECLYNHGERIYIGTREGLVYIQDNQTFHVDLLNKNPVNKISGTGDVIWIATENGIGRINESTNQQDFAGLNEGFPFTRLYWIDVDREGSIWISTGRDGLVQIRETGITNYTTFDGLQINKTNIIKQHGDKFFIGTDDGSLHLLVDNQIQKYNIKTPLDNAGIRDIHVDKQNIHWIASYRGLLRKNNNQEQLFSEKDGLPVTDIRRIIEDKDGILWLATRTGGIIKFKDGKVLGVFNKDNILKSNFILALEQDKKGNKYVGTHSGGLTIIKPDGSNKTYHFKDDDSGILIFNIHIDKNENIWVVSNLGLYLFRNEKFIDVLLDKRHVGVSYFDWLEDAEGNAWITSNIGIIKINNNALNGFLKDTDTKIPTLLIDDSDGMKNRECTGATRSIVGTNGNLHIPTIGGVVVVDPSALFVSEQEPMVYITKLKTDNKEYFKNDLKIPPGNVRYIFHFTAPGYISPKNLKFKYLLAGIDNEWIDIGNKRQAEYTNLPPGEYVFHILAANRSGEWNATPTVVRFNVLPYYYQTAWFKFLIVILTVLLLFFVYRWRIKDIEKRNEQLKKVNNELDRFVYSASHDLRAPLASVLGLVTLAKMDNKSNTNLYLEKIEFSINKLDRFIKDIIDFSRNARMELNIDNIDYKSLIEDVINDLRYLDEDRSISYKISVNCETPILGDKKRIEIILRNLISNAIKYKNHRISNPTIHIKVMCLKKKTLIAVEDNGIGIHENHIPNIFKMFYRGTETHIGSGLGLYIVKETLEKINGEVTVESKNNKGTIFTITLHHN